MDPIVALDSKSFVLLKDIYENSRNFLVEFAKTRIMYPRVCIEHEYVSFIWITTTLQMHKEYAVLLSASGEKKYNLTDHIPVLLADIEKVVPYRRSNPIPIMRQKIIRDNIVPRIASN